MKPAVFVIVILSAFLFFPHSYASMSGDNVTAVGAVSEFQNATVFMGIPETDGLIILGEVDNATIYSGGGANATINEGSLYVNLGAAREMGYRDIYLLYPVSYRLESISFDYELMMGNKSNVILIDMIPVKPDLTKNKGGIMDRSIVGIGTWSAIYSEIGGLKPFIPGKHHVDVMPYQNELVLAVDGNFSASSSFRQDNYLLIHLMTGDDDSLITGSISNLTVKLMPAPSLKDEGKNKVQETGKTSLSGQVKINASPIPVSASEDKGNETGVSKKLSGISLWFILAAAAGFLAAWGYVYIRYLKR